MWEDPNEDQQNGAITHYEVNMIETDSLHTFPTLTVFILPLMVSDLHPYYTYKLQAAAATSIGVGPYTQFLQFTMDEAGKFVLCHAGLAIYCFPWTQLLVVLLEM